MKQILGLLSLMWETGEGIPDSWLWLGSAQAAVSVWEVNKQMADVYFPLCF